MYARRCTVAAQSKRRFVGAMEGSVSPGSAVHKTLFHHHTTPRPQGQLALRGRRWGGSCVFHTTDISPTAPRRLVFPTPPIPSAKHPHRSAANTKSLSQRTTESLGLGGAQAARPLRIREEVAPRYAPAMLLTRFPTVETGLLYISTAHTHTTTLNNSQHFGLGFLAARLCWGRGIWAFARARKWMGEETMLMAAGTPSCATVAAELPRYGTSSGSTIGGNVNPCHTTWSQVSKLQVGWGGVRWGGVGGARRRWRVGRG